MMTEPSFRCRFTFLPMKLFALFKLKLSIFGSPFLFLVSYVGPALFADGSFLAVEHDVEFDVFASTGGFPGIFTMFHFFVSVCSLWLPSAFVSFKGHSETTFYKRGEGCVKVKLLLGVFIQELMDYYLLVGSLTLFLQIAVFLVVISGFLFRKQRKFRFHGFFMSAGVFLHLVVILVIMVPSFLEGLIKPIVASPFGILSIVTVIHVVLGTIAAILGVWIVSLWRFRDSLEFCAPKHRWMRFTLWVWIAALTIGFLLYLTLFWSLLFA